MKNFLIIIFIIFLSSCDLVGKTENTSNLSEEKIVIVDEIKNIDLNDKTSSNIHTEELQSTGVLVIEASKEEDQELTNKPDIKIEQIKKDIFGSIKKYNEQGELNFQIYGELNGYVDKIELEWVNNGNKKDIFIIDKPGDFEPEGYSLKRDGYIGFKYKFSGFDNIDLGLNFYIFRAYLNNEIVDKKIFIHKTTVCGKEIKSIEDLYTDFNGDSKLKYIKVIDDNYYSVVSKKIKNNNVELFLEKISCKSGDRNILFNKEGPLELYYPSDIVYNSLDVIGIYNNVLLFFTNGEGGKLSEYSNYLYDFGTSKVLKLDTDGKIDKINIGKSGIYILYNGGGGQNNKLVLIDKNNKQIKLFEDHSSNDEMGTIIISSDYLELKDFELLINKEIKLSLNKGNGTNTLEKIEKIISIDDY